ncbi:DUF3298 domain-containing protein [Zhouia sp. PK063]|uniref:DUF3298 and DUF4163 domain-containing protein n=1 Tax=Zhouia sp. PK063 TaxID=3373602 RepID=UPI00379599B0
MKSKILAVLALAAFLSSCTSDKKIEYEMKTVKEQTGNCDTEPCAKVDISYPYANSPYAPAKKINGAILDRIMNTMNTNPDKQIDEDGNLEEAIQSFKTEFTEARKDFPDASFGYEADIDARIDYDAENLQSFAFNSYVFTGGAHGSSNVTYINFDPKTGKIFENEDLFKNVDEFTKFAEKKFREKEEIKPDASINSKGYWFENDTFSLPQSIGFDDKGLVLLYNPYEISAYVDGQHVIEIPFDEVKPYLAVNPEK